MTIATDRYMAAFRTIWVFTGRMRCNIYRPISAWNLPEGITYNTKLDRFVGINGKPVEADWKVWGSKVEAKYLPGDVTTNFEMVLPGIAQPESAINICLPPDQRILDALRGAWGVQLANGFLYRVTADNRFPVGSAHPQLIQLTLKEAGQEVGEQHYAHVGV